MHGFFGSYKANVAWDLSSFEDKSFVKRTHSEGYFQLTQVTLPKFLNDKYFAEIDDCFLATEGVLFEADKPEEAIARYRNGETTFWNSWRGSFAGVLYDSKTDTLLVFNDHIGSKMLFYAKTKDGFVFASDLRIITTMLDYHSLQNSFVSAILEKGYNNNNLTFVEGIFRLTTGQYIHLRGSCISLAQYHQFDNRPWMYDEANMLKETNRLFRQAVKRVIRKNEQERLQHFYPLSGGLDSRLTQWVARQLTKQAITNFTFSQTGHYDHLLPHEISNTLGNKWMFLPLDGGDYIKNVDGVCERTEWLVNYILPIEADYFAELQNWDKIGVVLTGINGDNIFATETDNAHEIERICTQGFNGYSLGSPLIFQHYTESYSPFCDVDVLDYVLHVPTIKRRNYYFYDRLILSYYPDMAQWHHKHMPIGRRPPMVTIMGRNIPLRDVAKRICRTLLKRLHIYDAYLATKEESMNPYDYWSEENPSIKAYMQDYYTRHSQLLSGYPWFHLCEEKMRIGSLIEKGKVLTIESAITHLNLHIC